jgi:hypothetical protein
MAYPQNKYVDGLSQVIALSAYCYNNGKTYLCYDGDPSATASKVDATDSDKRRIGSVVNQTGREGTLNLQYTLATDELPTSANLLKPGFIVSFRSRFYVLGEPKVKIIKNEAIKFSVSVTELVNPFIPSLLSTLGQQLAVAASVSHTISCVASGTRTGAVVAYSVESFATPGAAAPTGVSINATTGLLTFAAVTAGVQDVRVIASDTVTLADGTTDQIFGFGRYTPTLS